MALTAGIERKSQGDERPGSPARALWRPWVAAARQGDRQAFTKLHGHFGRLVHAVVITRVGPSDAKDLVQDVFLTMWQKLGTLEDDQAFPAWLLSLARTRAARALRDHQPMDPLDEEPGLAAPDRTSSPDAKKVLKALQALPETYAETLAMRLVEGMSGPEIAERTGLTPGSVRVNLHRGMKLLREKLGLPPAEEGPGDE
ncbi:MAG: sigma-70 family RNA polymerase sigma factor [Myxococcales bacterium]|nr:sigma-70 family RNA polymerase sigma factor [Myxococcales bacterium]